MDHKEALRQAFGGKGGILVLMYVYIDMSEYGALKNNFIKQNRSGHIDPSCVKIRNH